MESNIKELWNKFTYYSAFEEIILANNELPYSLNAGIIKSFNENKESYKEIKKLIEIKGKRKVGFVELLE